MTEPNQRTFGPRLAPSFGRILAFGLAIGLGAVTLAPAPAGAQGSLDRLLQKQDDADTDKKEENKEEEKPEPVDPGPYNGADRRVFDAMNRTSMGDLEAFKTAFPQSPLIGRVNGFIADLEAKAAEEKRKAEAARQSACETEWSTRMKNSCDAAAVQSFANRCTGTEGSFYAFQRAVQITAKQVPECVTKPTEPTEPRQVETPKPPEEQKPDNNQDNNDSNDTEVTEPEDRTPQFTVNTITPVTRWADRRVNVRDAPNTTTGQILGGLAPDQQVTVTGRVPGGPWLQIRYNRRVAFVHGGFLTDDDPKDRAEPAERPAPSIQTTRRTQYANRNVNVRDYPDTNNTQVLGRLRKDDRVTVTGNVRNSRWVRIDYRGRSAYVLSSYLTSTQPTEREKPEDREPENKPDTGNRMACGGQQVDRSKIQMVLGSGLVFPYYNSSCTRQGSLRVGRRAFYQVISSGRTCGQYRIVRCACATTAGPTGSAATGAA